MQKELEELFIHEATPADSWLHIENMGENRLLANQNGGFVRLKHLQIVEVVRKVERRRWSWKRFRMERMIIQETEEAACIYSSNGRPERDFFLFPSQREFVYMYDLPEDTMIFPTNDSFVLAARLKKMPLVCLAIEVFTKIRFRKKMELVIDRTFSGRTCL